MALTTLHGMCFRTVFLPARGYGQRKQRQAFQDVLAYRLLPGLLRREGDIWSMTQIAQGV